MSFGPLVKQVGVALAGTFGVLAGWGLTDSSTRACRGCTVLVGGVPLGDLGVRLGAAHRRPSAPGNRIGLLLVLVGIGVVRRGRADLDRPDGAHGGGCCCARRPPGSWCTCCSPTPTGCWAPGRLIIAVSYAVVFVVISVAR